CDDISFEVGRMRLRQKGSAGGHNGLKSIIEKLGSDAFARLKIGVGQKPHPDYDLADWVLSKFTKDDLEKLKPALESVPGAIRLLLERDLAKAQNRFNR
ncbi:MAG: aminoacyl-tRNA hydrolase, partial [Clostridia bacterium]|nr:aminoacyl-tRNA hydrolase [Clostridia bacterium]